MNKETSQKVLDNTSGFGIEFYSSDSLIKYRLNITGTPLANIEAYYVERTRDNNSFYLKVKCSDWNGAIVYLQANTYNVDDNFSNTDDSFTKDDVRIFYYS